MARPVQRDLLGGNASDLCRKRAPRANKLWNIIRTKDVPHLADTVAAAQNDNDESDSVSSRLCSSSPNMFGVERAAACNIWSEHNHQRRQNPIGAETRPMSTGFFGMHFKCGETDSWAKSRMLKLGRRAGGNRDLILVPRPRIWPSLRKARPAPRTSNPRPELSHDQSCGVSS